MVGAAATSNVRVQATAAIVGDTAPVPLIVLHPYLQSSLTVGGSGIFKICGGPVRSIQVNSCAGSGSKIRVTTPSGNSIKDCGTGIPSTVFNGNRTVDLTKAGINDPGNCTTGTGADFGNFGLPLAPPPANISCCLGTAGRYVDPASPIQDPLIDVAPPAQPLASLTSPGGVQIGIPVPNGVYGCPSSPAAPCNLYLPGYYANGFQAKGETALMAPGVYYMGSQGFSNASNGVLQMAACPASGAAAPLPAQIDPDTDTGCGMLVFNTGTDGKAAFNLGSNSSASLTGSLDNGKYAGILFFQDRTVTSAFTHSLGGGGNMALLGTIYLVNNDKINYPQTLSLQGNSGSSTQVSGQIVIDLLSLGGGGSITMALGPGQRVTRKVALVR